MSCSKNDEIDFNDQRCNVNLPNVSSWTVLGSMRQGRYDAGFELYCNRVYALGGFSNDSGSGEYYNLETNKWHTTANLLKGQQGVTSELLNEKIYLFGNYEQGSHVQVYDLQKDEWHFTTDFPVNNLYWAASESHEEKIYIIGGYIPAMGDEYPNTMYVFDTNSETYSQYEIPGKLEMPNSTKVGDLFYVWSAGILYSFDPQDYTWRKIESASSYIKFNQEGVEYKDNIIFIGGSNSPQKDSLATTDITIYNPDLDSWSVINSSINYSRHYGYGVFALDTGLFILGGREAGSWELISALEYKSNLEIY